MTWAAGVDVGSTQTKAVIVDTSGAIAGRSLIATGANVIVAAQDAFRAALAEVGIAEDEVGFVVGTGYGRVSRCRRSCSPAKRRWPSHWACSPRGGSG